jgi:flagellar motility protein MotE (MotC chaperone)
MRLIATAIIAILVLTGCQSAYYAAWEKVGVEKRDILVDRVENAKESQEDAQEEFSSALEAFSAVVAFEGGELEDVYNKLNSEYENSLSAANEVSSRIDKVEGVAEALFDEWEDELEKYQNASLKRESSDKLRDTERRYSALIKTMRKAESRMAPVLSAFQDNVLYLKHNLNASAIGALQGELSTIQNDVDQLIEQMNSAIAESDAFIAAMSN